MKKKGKIIAIVLGIVIGVGAVVGTGVAIGSVTNKVVGTEAAKILLARENMVDGEKTFSFEEIIRGDNGEPVVQEAMRLSRAFADERESVGTLVYNSPAGKVYKDGDKYYFQDISGASGQGLVIESRLYNIETRVENAAENIHYLKNELNIVNKWVKRGYSKYYLDVTSNCETLLEYYNDESQKSLWVVRRETGENASSTYHIMYTDMAEDRLVNPVYLVYTPNERYEYYYGHDGNGADYLIAEKSRGYWNVYMPRETSFQNVIFRDDFAFATGADYGGDSSFGEMIRGDLKEDIITEHSRGLVINTSAFNGISALCASEDIVFEGSYNNGENIYYDVDFEKYNQIEIKLANGKTIKEGDSFTYGERTVSVEFMSFSFYPDQGMGLTQYAFKFSLEMGENIPLAEKLDLFKKFLNDNGLTCKYSIDLLRENMERNSEVSKALTDFYTWNGYLMDSGDNFKKAEQVMLDKVDAMYAEYEAAKDAEEADVNLLAKVSSSQDFAGIDSLTVGSASYNGGKVTVTDLSLKAKTSVLYEDGGKYRLQIGITKIDGNGNFSSQNTVHLSTENSIEAKTYEGSDFTLTANASYDIPLALEEGNYVLVAYVVTDGEGIRISEMVPVGFVDTVNDTIETSSLKINIGTDDSKLLMEYTSKLYYNITVSGQVDYVTLRRKMMAEVLKYGYPMYNEEIKNSDGEEITEGTVAPGEYKLKFVVPAVEGAVTGYVVCVVG